MKTEPFLIPSRLPKTKTAAPEPVAIIGISCAFPMAENPEMFWENLAGEKDCISEIPPERWDWRQYYGDPQKDKNASNVKWGGFIDETAQFDPLFFGISPHEAEMMDPQQRLLMMHVWKAIEDAGRSAKSLSGTNTGIFAGTTNSGYAQEASKFHIEIEGSSAAGTVPSIGPNRMSYFLNIHGPSEPIETACSSSLVAVHRAVRQFRPETAASRLQEASMLLCRRICISALIKRECSVKTGDAKHFPIKRTGMSELKVRA